DTSKCPIFVGVTSTNGDLKGFIDQNQSPTKGKRILPAYVSLLYFSCGMVNVLFTSAFLYFQKYYALILFYVY
uniref:Uncharacterized protein n=1 Tax=Meleagris gallopavo TaxID=9103 RepID=A0A803YQJ3_MELGA